MVMMRAMVFAALVGSVHSFTILDFSGLARTEKSTSSRRSLIHNHAAPVSYDAGNPDITYHGDPCQRKGPKQCGKESMCVSHGTGYDHVCHFLKIGQRSSSRGDESYTYRRVAELGLHHEINEMHCGEAFTSQDCQTLNEMTHMGRRCKWTFTCPRSKFAKVKQYCRDVEKYGRELDEHKLPCGHIVQEIYDEDTSVGITAQIAIGVPSATTQNPTRRLLAAFTGFTVASFVGTAQETAFVAAIAAFAEVRVVDVHVTSVVDIVGGGVDVGIMIIKNVKAGEEVAAVMEELTAISDKLKSVGTDPVVGALLVTALNEAFLDQGIVFSAAPVITAVSQPKAVDFVATPTPSPTPTPTPSPSTTPTPTV